MEGQNQDTTLANPNVMNKHRAGADIVNGVLPKVIELCVPGALIANVCARGDELMEEGVRFT